MNKCSVKSCFREKGVDDDLFCRSCRRRWVDIVKTNNLTVDTSDVVIQAHLEDFKGHG